MTTFIFGLVIMRYDTIYFHGMAAWITAPIREHSHVDVSSIADGGEFLSKFSFRHNDRRGRWSHADNIPVGMYSAGDGTDYRVVREEENENGYLPIKVSSHLLHFTCRSFEQVTF